MLTSALLGILAVAPPFATLTATVNDPSSHGVVGDRLLSLDEAIQLANRTLAITSLSRAEQAQLSGNGTFVDEIVVDAALTPTITLSAPLTPLVGGGMGTGHVELVGIAQAGWPVLQGGAHATVLSLREHLIHVSGLRIVGGQVGIDAQMGPSGMTTPHMALVHDCELAGQSVAGIRIHGTGTDESMLMVSKVALTGMPVGVLLDDRTAGGMVMAECEYLTMDGVTLGADVVENGTGLMSMFLLFRSTFDHGQTLARSRRAPTSTRQFMFRFVHCDVHCTGDVVDLQGVANGLTMVHHHHSDFVAGAGHKAFWVWPRTAEFDIHGSEMVFVGDVSITGNPFTMRVWQQNNEYRDGHLVYDVDGALPNLLWNRYHNCTFEVPATARSPVTVVSSEFVGTDVDGQSFFAPIRLQGCYRSGGVLSGQVTEQLPAPSAFLGTTDVSPAAPQLGSMLHLAADMPQGVAVVWDVTAGIARPTTTAEPFRIYGQPANAIVLAGMYAFRSRVDVPVPTSAAILGVEYYVQGIALSLSGASWIPPFHLPRGQRVVPRL